MKFINTIYLFSRRISSYPCNPLEVGQDLMVCLECPSQRSASFVRDDESPKSWSSGRLSWRYSPSKCQ